MSGSAVRVGTQLWMRSATLLCCILGIARSCPRTLPSCLARLEEIFVQIHALVSEPRQEFSHENNCCDVSCRDQVEFTTMSQLAKPESCWPADIARPPLGAAKDHILRYPVFVRRLIDECFVGRSSR